MDQHIVLEYFLMGIELDPIAAEPWPHTKPITSNHNWDWNLEATNAGLGLDLIMLMSSQMENTIIMAFQKII